MRSLIPLFVLLFPMLLTAAEEAGPDGPVQELPPMEVRSEPVLFSFETGDFGDAVAELGRSEWTKTGAADLATALGNVPAKSRPWATTAAGSNRSNMSTEVRFICSSNGKTGFPGDTLA